ncbi:hypothetical protein BX616_009899 [Lobosporangium transversale]|uniref:Uncharacterized protein n=1 Tax=Lobosporangium transversale TaxID=64571 RepID=A0A1Y2GWQ7_9FUNG|nr:hypothetical protein BCR41DRAFT_419683 [Lobosporangium transversale]KAF9913542.1 hypothetical protein BX616_009899 [Lobosporangium transversale]ORZ26707.1 hypothetical protein BCR41DRAFT_419683 [Lobosporangium transversale]|eukprot:XP_021884470.1 hypothetical protein BCR41DRAFT_419683 [Lobosporangium transversale]
MATYIRSLARAAARISKPSSLLISRQVPAAMVARKYHAFRPSEIAYKGKKHAILDEDDEELEAELQELEREKREMEALERGESLDKSENAEISGSDSVHFEELYNKILDHTTITTPHHELPRHTSLFHLTRSVSSLEQAQSLPPLVKQWRQRKLPISIFVTNKLIHAICKAGSPETAIELLGDRETYGLNPGQATMRRVIRSFIKDVDVAGQGSDEGLEKLDGAFKVMALIPYYNLAADDASVYANLVRGSLMYGGEEGLRRASVTMDEYLLIDGERETPLTRKRAAELVAAAERLNEAYKAKGDAVEKIKELEKHITQWKKGL